VSRKAINTLFIIGSCLYIPGIALIIWGYIDLFHNISQSAYVVSVNPNPLNGFGAFIGFFWGGMLIISIGSVSLLVARIGALMELGKAQDWVWFILMIIFGWIVLLLYLIVGPKSEPLPKSAGYPPYPYPTPGYPPQAPGMPPVQPWYGYPPQAPSMPPFPTDQPSIEQQNTPEKPND
jgi:hypothetical protein